jgi:hypothetical protein
MQHLFRTSMLALLSGVGFAAAQQTQDGSNGPSTSPPPSSNSSQQIHPLTPTQRQAIVQGLRTK